MRIALSTSSFFPNTELGFRMAAEHGYDGVEVMVNHDRRSQRLEDVLQMSQEYAVPVVSVHVPCLVITQHVWSFDPRVKLQRSVEMASAVGASTVVVHPPFRWQRDYSAAFAAMVGDLHSPELRVAVENMYTVERLGRRMDFYSDATDDDLRQHDSLTFDTSHAGADRRDLIEMYEGLAGTVDHLHLSDSTMTAGDEHLPPGFGSLPLEELARKMTTRGFTGDVVLEVAIGRLPSGSRGAATRDCREWAAAAFAR